MRRRQCRRSGRTRWTSPSATDGIHGDTTPRDHAGLLEAAGDAVASAYLVVALCVTVWFDGGLDAGGFLLLGGTALLVAPVAYTEVARSPVATRLLILAWGLGIVVSTLFAVHRADMTEAILTYSLAPIAFLSARRLWRRSWGPAAVLAVVAASAVAYWVHAFLSWLGPPLEHLRSNWLSVSWHNPTGALMGSFGVIAFALAVRSEPRWRVPATVASGLALAGLWLTGSRGAMIATGLGLVVTVLASRDVAWRGLVAGAGATLVAAVLAVTALMQVGGIHDPSDDARAAVPTEEQDRPGLVRIEATAESNLRARFAHMDAALELFSQHPVAGAGMGAYTELGNRLASPGANLTRSAHNEFVEALAEGGIVFGVPFVLTGLAVAGLACRRIFAATVRRGAVRAGLGAGAAGVAVLLLVHTAVDIDWRYPVIPALLAVAAAVLIGPSSPRPVRAARGAAVLPLVVALAGGGLAAGTEAWTRAARVSDASDVPLPSAPWDLYRRIEAAQLLADEGHLAGARRALEPAQRWNPESPSIDAMDAVLAYRAGDLTVGELTSVLDGQSTGAASYVRVAETLLDDGHRVAAAAVIAEGFALTSEHAGTPFARMELWELRIRHAAATGGCVTAERLASDASDDERVERYVSDLDGRLSDVLADAGCTDG